MTADSKIEWTDHTFNVWWGCARVSSGCRHCYADTLASRWGHELWRRHGPRKPMADQYWREPLQWNRNGPARVFCGSMCDLFEAHPERDVRVMQDRERARLWGLIESTPNLTWQLLTKRPENVSSMSPWGDQWPDNVWIGTSVEDQRTADVRIPQLRTIPAVVRFLSCEPLLSRVDLSRWIGDNGCGCFKESGGRRLPGRRDGRVGDRPTRSYMAGVGSPVESVARDHSGDPVRTASGGTPIWEVPTSQGDVLGSSDSCAGTSAGVEAHTRSDTGRTNGQPQERTTHRQPPPELRAGDTRGAIGARSAGSTSGPTGSVWSAQCDGGPHDESGPRDMLSPGGRGAAECPRCGFWRAVSDDLADSSRRPPISWLIAGGESGPGSRPMHPGWVRGLRDQCEKYRVPFFLKQWGEWTPVTGADHWRNRKGTDHEVRSDGYHWPLSEPHDAGDGTEVLMRRVGKKHAGRELDGRVWDDYPAVKPV